jgi:D-lactate dehydrogenase (cytochrome)
MTADITPCTTDCEEYLHDESRRIGAADAIAFPTTEAEVVQVVRQARERGLSITTQGARTGIVAGAVPEGGLIVNLSRMNGIGEPSASGLIVQPGALLSDVRAAIESAGLFFGPDPTETSASIGGMVACNASGAMSFRYGPTRKWVDSIRMVLADGDVLSIKRGEHIARGRSFALTTEGGRIIEGTLPTYAMPAVKSSAGYYVADDMDLIDLLIGSEGTLGIITEIGLRLTDRPAAINNLTVFLPNQEAAIKLVQVAREADARPVAIEFFNHDVLDLLRKAKATYPAFESIPLLKPSYHTALYMEFHADDADLIEEAVMELMETVMELGGSDDDTWFATTEREMEPIKAFRHATPEAVNLLIGERKREVPELTKLGTDMSVPDAGLVAALAMYDAGLADNGLESVIFGHIGNNHVHVNILPHDMDEYARGKELYLTWAREIVKMGGSVSAEHGIGKLKVPFLRMMYGPATIEEMRALRRLFDPDSVLNEGVMFTP